MQPQNNRGLQSWVLSVLLDYLFKIAFFFYLQFERHGKVTDTVIKRSQDIANIVSSVSVQFLATIQNWMIDLKICMFLFIYIYIYISCLSHFKRLTLHFLISWQLYHSTVLVRQSIPYHSQSKLYLQSI